MTPAHPRPPGQSEESLTTTPTGPIDSLRMPLSHLRLVPVLQKVTQETDVPMVAWLRGPHGGCRSGGKGQEMGEGASLFSTVSLLG